jgi:hypothetical protein
MSLLWRHYPRYLPARLDYGLWRKMSTLIAHLKQEQAALGGLVKA